MTKPEYRDGKVLVEACQDLLEYCGTSWILTTEPVGVVAVPILILQKILREVLGDV